MRLPLLPSAQNAFFLAASRFKVADKAHSGLTDR
jgi:hypothetical protein